MPSYQQLTRRQGHLTRGMLFSAIAGTLLSLPETGFATQYSLEYGVDTRYRYDDNVGLRPDDEIDVNGAIVSLPAKLTIAEERYNAYVDSKLTTSKYDESGYNSDDQMLNLGGEYGLERGLVTGMIGIDRSSTLETAFLDTGVVGATANRVEAYYANANTSYYLSPKYNFVAGASYRETDYDTNRFVDNQYAVLSLGIANQYTEKTSIIVQANANRFENDAFISIESDGLGLQVGFTTLFSERLKASMLGGYSYVETEYSAPEGITARDDDDSSSWVIDAEVEYENEQSYFSARFLRRESASGDGYLVFSNQANSKYGHRLSERLSFEISLIAGNSGALDDRINNDRDYIEGSTKLAYRLTESWYLSGRYVHRYQDRERDSGDANGNMFFATFTYKPNAISWAR